VKEELTATTRCLVLLKGTFYSIGVFSPTQTIGMLRGPIFHMSDAARYATLRASEPNPLAALVSAFFVCTLPSPGAS
jgi:hypothetical protein